MRKQELEQARMNAGRSASHQLEPEIYMSDIDMESLGSRSVDRTTMVVSIGDKYRRDYRRWQRQGWRIVVGSVTKVFGCLP